MGETAPRIDRPEPGYYLTRVVKGGPMVPVEILRARVGGLMATLGGEGVKVYRVWPYCARHPITQKEFTYRLQVREWAETYAPRAPEANAREAVDLGKIPPLF